MNAKDLCVELRVRFSTIKYYGELIGVNIFKAGQKLAPEEINQLKAVHFGQLDVKEIVADKITNVCKQDESKPGGLEIFTPLTNTPIDLTQNFDQFQNRQNRQINFGHKTIETVFSDYEAFCICKGLEDSYSRSLAMQYFKNVYDGDSIYQAHSIARTALNKYGGHVLSFILTLPALPFKALDATQIFSELDKRNEKVDFPVLRIAFQNKVDKTEKIQISFYTEVINGKRIKNEHILLVKNNTTKQTIMKISREGVVLPEEGVKQIVPILQLFIRFASDTKKMIINYGLETGECSLCGRELSDKNSIRRGIGPICAKY